MLQPKQTKKQTTTTTTETKQQQIDQKNMAKRIRNKAKRLMFMALAVAFRSLLPFE
jgi:hypothetical protein